MERVLFVEDDEALRLTQSLYLQREGFEVVTARDRSQAREKLARQTCHVVVTDLRLGKDNGIDVLKDVRELQPGAEVLVITGYGSVDSAVAAMKEGAYDYITKPVEPETLVRIIHKALEHQRLQREITLLRDQFAAEAGLIDPALPPTPTPVPLTATPTTPPSGISGMVKATGTKLGSILVFVTTGSDSIPMGQEATKSFKDISGGEFWWGFL